MAKDSYWPRTRNSSSSTTSSNSNTNIGRRAPPTQIPSGCMCAFFQAFDFHPFNFSTNQQQHSPLTPIPDHNTLPKAAEAPRNSLESEDGSLPSISKEQNFKFPKNIRTKTSERTRTRGASFDGLSSPGTKTPTLVARLMGLDLLPDANSSSSSSSSCLSTPKQQGHSHHNNRPKKQQHIQIMRHRHSTDSALRPSSRKPYVEHRLSLQINKENRGLSEDLETTPRFSFTKMKFEDNNNNSRSPSHYARQIVKQVKESVSRKVGLDITNTIKSRENQRQEDSADQFKSKKSPKTVAKPVDENSPGKHSNTSYSPRLSRFNDVTSNNKHSPTTTPKDQNTRPVVNVKASSPPPLPVVNNIVQQFSRISTKPKPQVLSEKEVVKNQKSFPKCKKTSLGDSNSRLNKPPQTSIRNKQQESFITRPTSTTRGNDNKTKSKRTHPLSTNLLNNFNSNTVPNLLPFKIDPTPQKQVSEDTIQSTQLFSSSRHTLANQGTNDESKSKSNGALTTTGSNNEGSEYQYITAILSRTGIHRITIPHLNFQWFSSTHPLDPSLFHRLELYPTSNSLASFPNNDKVRNFMIKNHLGPRCNRRLMFDLVDEMLSEILIRPKRYCGLLLLETVWKKVRSFPRAKCEVLEDIDGLIEMEDMKEKEKEEGDRLVAEIEGKIFETLVHETFTVMVGGGGA